MKRKTSKRASSTLTLIAIIITAAFYIFFGDGMEYIKETFHKAGLSSIFTKELTEGTLSVHIIDVLQGDCTLIRSSDGNILIDTGKNREYERVHVYLDALDIKTIDYFICTHPHEDHIGGAAKIIEDYTVKTLLMTDAVSTNYTFENLLDKIEEYNVNAIIPSLSEEFTLGDITFKILAPIKETDDLNNMSLVVRLTYGDTSFMFTGDAESFSEKYILEKYSASELDCDFLKVGHHGSYKASSIKFLEAVSPEIASISCEAYNEYGHPHGEVLDRLNKAGVKEILRTDLDGTIVITSNGKELTVVK